MRDREFPNAKAAVYSFDRLFQTAMVDEDVQSGYSTILFTPNPERPLHDSWFINQGDNIGALDNPAAVHDLQAILLLRSRRGRMHDVSRWE